MGDLLAIFSSFIAAVYSSRAQHLGIGKKIPISFYLGPMALLVILFSLCISFYFEEPIVIFSTNPKYGLFGLFSST